MINSQCTVILINESNVLSFLPFCSPSRVPRFFIFRELGFGLGVRVEEETYQTAPFLRLYLRF